MTNNIIIFHKNKITQEEKDIGTDILERKLEDLLQ